MAVINIIGKDSHSYGLDHSQLDSPDAQECFDQILNGLKLSHACFHDDGQICFIPQFNLWPWDFSEKHPLKDKFFEVFMPWCTLGNKWEPFYERVSKEFDWDYFELTGPYSLNGFRYVFYKRGVMPEMPIPSSDCSHVRGLEGWTSPVEQGGIMYKSFDVWEKSNKALALTGNGEVFIQLVKEMQIVY